MFRKSLSCTASAIQHAIQIECCTDQCKMGKGLRKIPKSFTLRPGLLSVKPQMIGISQHTLKQQPCLIQLFRKGLTGTGQRFYQPKRTHIESAFFAWKPVNPRLWWIAIDKTIANKAEIGRAHV